jgi:hypothetical protein
MHSAEQAGAGEQQLVIMRCTDGGLTQPDEEAPGSLTATSVVITSQARFGDHP